MKRWARTLGLVGLGLLIAAEAAGRQKSPPRDSLANYLEKMQQQDSVASANTAGSLWQDHGRLASIAADAKASRVGDLLTVQVVQDVTARNSGSVATDRSLKASSGIDSVAGQPDLAAVQNLLGLHSSQTLAGKASASTNSSLRTALSGRVMAVLPSGNLVVEAERTVSMNHERQTVLVRGVVRPADISALNSVLSNQMGNLELELKGKGVISDGTRPPNKVVAFILKLVGF